MTPSEYIQLMIDRLNDAEEMGREVLIAAGDATTEMGIRIFEKGQNASGAKFSYSTKGPVWISDIVGPQGKKNDGKTGRAQKTSVYDSYKAFRSKQGRSDNPVNWRLTGELKSDFFNSPTDVPELMYQSGFVEIRLKNSENIDKRVGIDKKYNNVFEVNTSERETYYDTLVFELKNTLSRR